MTRALIVVDVQNDFAHPRGSLYVEGADNIIFRINEMVQDALREKHLVVYTRDWHPPVTNHFQEFGGPWPAHCVGGTWGAEFHDDLFVERDPTIIYKGMRTHQDGYSGFNSEKDGKTYETVLRKVLEEHDVDHVEIVGIAFDVCVKATALDAVKLGYKTWVYEEETASVTPEGHDQALKEMVDAGVEIY